MDRGRENGSSSAPPPDFPHPFHKLRKNSSSPNNHNSLQSSPTIKSLGVVNPPFTKNVGTGANLGRNIPLAHGQLGIPTSTVSSGAINLSSDQASSSANSKPEPNSSRELVKFEGSEGSQKSEGEAPAAASKIVSQNVNGTLALTGIPRTESELQLFRVLQRGNLLAYFDVMIELGGDDVQQLCEAGEEEFLEIMSLIGMSSKPLHVRRLQKALQEWMSNPALFQTPVLPPGVALNGHQTTLTPSSSPPAQIQIPQTRTSPQPQLPIRPIPYHHNSPAAAAIAAAAQHHAKLTISTVTNDHNHHSSNSNSPNGSTRSNDHSSNGYRNGELRIPLDQLIPSHFLEQRIRTNSQPASPAPSDSPSESSSHSPLPFLQDHELVKISHAAGQIVKSLPPYVFTPQVPSKRKFSGDYEAIIRLPPNDPRRVEEMRKMSTIYGRADSSSSTVPNKRKYPKPLSLHEVAVNEAAGQLVRHVPALLTYRDELCALAKQVVRDSGLAFSASSAPSTNGAHIYSQLNNNSLAYSNQNKKEVTNGHSLAVEPYSGAKRLRLGDHGLEIQEYSRPPSNHSSNSSNDEGSGLQITPITNLPSRISPLSPLPLELVTVSSNSPSSRRGSGDIGHSPSRRASGSSSSDLNNVQPPKNGLRVTSLGVSGGSINISHDPSIRVTSSSPNAPLLPIKSEPSSS